MTFVTLRLDITDCQWDYLTIEKAKQANIHLEQAGHMGVVSFLNPKEA